MFEMRPLPGTDPKHRLDAGRIIETAKNLANDINLRLPGSNLAILARELAVLAVATEERGGQRSALPRHQGIIRPGDRSGLPGLWYLARHVHASWEFGTINNVFDAINTGFNLLVLLAGACGSA